MHYQKTENDYRIYSLHDSCIFRKNKDEFGGLSNMASTFPLEVNGITVKSSEVLYQLCKFPDDVALQERILFEKSPYSTKLITRGKTTRPDWIEIRVMVMRWALQAKLTQHYYVFGALLAKTSDKNIVEHSEKDLSGVQRKSTNMN